MSDKCMFFHCYIAFVTQINVLQIYIFLIVHLLNNDKFLQKYAVNNKQAQYTEKHTS